MGLVDDDGEAPATLPGPDLVEDERELLHGGDDDLLAGLDEAAQIARTVRVADRGAHLRGLPDGVADLAIQDSPVGDDDDGIEHGRPVSFEFDQLVPEPCDGVALAAARRVLDQVFSPGAALGRIAEEVSHHVDLVVTGPDLLPRLPPCPVVATLHQLGVVLDDIGQALARQHLAPQVVGLQSVRVRRIAGAVVPAPVEWQKPGRLAGEPGAEAHLGLVHGEMRDAPTEFEELLARVSVPPVLLDRVVHGLLGQVVLEFERDDGQAVDEERDVERPLRLVAAVAKLPGDAEPVPLEAFTCPLVPRRGRPVEEIHMMCAMVDTLAQHVDNTPLRYLPLQPREESAPGRTVLVQGQGVGNLRLGRAHEGGQLDQINTILAVVVEIAAARPANAAVAG